MKKLLVGIASLVLLALLSGRELASADGRLGLEAQERVVLKGEPTIKIESGPKGACRDMLNESQRRQYRVVIVERDGRYYWKSRENRELTRVGSGSQYTYFIDPRGGGYVKVVSQGAVTGAQYFEHLSLGLATLTYWGEALHFAP